MLAVTNIAVSAFDGNQWLPIDSTELAGLRGEGWLNHPLAGQPGIYTGLFPIPTDSHGNSWLVHENHLAFYDGTDIIPVDSVIIPDSERRRIFRPLAVDSCDVVWFSLDGRLIAYDSRSVSLRRFAEPIPTHAFVKENKYPNPFSPSTTFFFWLTSAGNTTIEFINHSGNTVRTMAFNSDGPGRYRTSWNCLNDKGESAESGIYAVRISQQGSSFTREKAFIVLR